MMKQLQVPFGGTKNFAEPVQINVINWNEYPYRPDVSFCIAYDIENLFIRFNVREKYIRALATENNDQVWLDSCVEFFLSPERNDDYYNFECNCIGTKLLGFRKPGQAVEHAGPEVMDQIRVQSSLGSLLFEEKTGDFSWQLEAKIPWNAFWKHRIENPKGQVMRANFYKCGDELTEPHFISWNPVLTGQPSFHQPDFFGELLFL